LFRHIYNVESGKRNSDEKEKSAEKNREENFHFKKDVSARKAVEKEGNFEELHSTSIPGNDRRDFNSKISQKFWFVVFSNFIEIDLLLGGVVDQLRNEPDPSQKFLICERRPVNFHPFVCRILQIPWAN